MKIALALFGVLAAAGAARAGGMLKAGDAFPAWHMVDQDGKPVSSSQYAGKTYLLWYYVKASTPG